MNGLARRLRCASRAAPRENEPDGLAPSLPEKPGDARQRSSPFVAAGGYTELGVARVGSYWTQIFGGSTEYKGNLVKPGTAAPSP